MSELFTRQANQLQAGDVIVAPDGSHHTVTEIEHHGLAAAWLTIVTDTGLRLDKSQDYAKLDTYDCLPRSACNLSAR